jgi:hypothetical protein
LMLCDNLQFVFEAPKEPACPRLFAAATLASVRLSVRKVT